MTKVGLLGGSFDPVHIGHLILAEEALAQLGLERVLFVPGRRPPHKLGKQLALAHDRLRMVELAIEGNPAFKASDVELRRDGPSYSLVTVEQLRKEHPDWDIFFLIGADTLPELPTWFKVAELAALCKFATFSRPGQSLGNVAPLRGVLSDEQIAAIEGRCVEGPLIGVSSTDVRRRVHDGRSIRYLVPDAVRDYIVEQGLYRR